MCALSVHTGVCVRIKKLGKCLTQENQFGFKKKHSTDLCVFTVKSTIKYYNMYNSPVYSCFLDASKAYDRVNHWTLFNKLLKRSNSSHYCTYTYVLV